MLSWVSWETSTCWLTWHRTEFRRSFLLIFRVEVLSVKCVSASSPSPELLKSALEWQDLVKTPSVSVGGNEARVRVKHSAHLKRNICVTKLKICVLSAHMWRMNAAFLFKWSLHSAAENLVNQVSPGGSRESVFGGTFNESKWGQNLGQTVHFAQRWKFWKF